MEEQLKANALLMEGYEKSFEEKLADAKAQAEAKNKAVRVYEYKEILKIL